MWHNLKILYINLKSINIYSKQGYDVRIGDFWATKILKQTFFVKAFIETKTPYYLSPEIIKDNSYNDINNDWALGCILYELSIFRYPYISKNKSELF